MRLGVLLVATIAALGLSGCSHTSAVAGGFASADARGTGIAKTATSTNQSSPVSANENPVTIRVDFATEVRPIFEAKCQPCHFNGGKVYAQMPFDRPETIKRLGPKLFTRIKEENERQVIRAFLAQP